jgi:hypothetical protein
LPRRLGHGTAAHAFLGATTASVLVAIALFAVSFAVTFLLPKKAREDVSHG